MLFVSLPHVEPMSFPPVCWRMSSALLWGTEKGRLWGLLLRAQLLGRWGPRSGFRAWLGPGPLRGALWADPPKQLIVSVIGVLHVSLVTINSITLRPGGGGGGGASRPAVCSIGLPALME